MKRTNILIVLSFCAATMAAQEVAIPSPEDIAKGKEINNIKLSEQAVYADVMEMATDDNEAVSLAQQKSINMLQAHVIEVFAKRMHMEKKDVQEIWDVIDDKCQNIVVRKGDLFRVFTYIMKDAIGLGPKKPKKGDVEKYLGPDPVEAEVATTDTVALKEAAFQLTNTITGGKDSIDNTVPPVIATTPVTTTPTQVVTATQPATPVQTVPVQATAQAVPVQAVTDTPAQTTTTSTPATTVPVQAVSVQTPPAQTAPVQATPPAPVTQPTPVTVIEVPELAQTMMSKSNMTELMRYLSQEKSRQALMFGNFNTMQYPAKCYVVVIDKASKNIVAVLDKGQRERMNFVTKQIDNLNNYKGGKYAAILVQEY